jgi:hypothetical protein
MWHDLRGTPKRYSGTNGTVTIPNGVTVLQIHALASASGGTVQIFDDAAAVTIPANSGWWGVQFQHLLAVANAVSGNTIVFSSNIAAYFIDTVDTTGAT